MASHDAAGDLDAVVRSGRAAHRHRATSPSCSIPASGSRISPPARSPRSQGGIGLNLIVDNDIPKSSSIRVPQGRRRVIRAVARRVRSVGRRGRRSRTWPVRDEGLFATFADRVREVSGDAVAGPLLDDYWPRVLRRRGEARPSACDSRWRGASSRRLGRCQSRSPAERRLRDRRVPLVRVAPARPAPAVSAGPQRRPGRVSRRLIGSGASNHPVAALAAAGRVARGAVLGLAGGSAPPPARLLVRQRAREMDLRIAGEDEVLLELPAGPGPRGVLRRRALRELPARSIRLRTRALTTTMFSRFLLGDLFIHGIGGAKYDELGDEIARRYSSGSSRRAS